MNNLQAKFLSLGFLIVTLTVCRNTEVDKAVSPTEGINLIGSLTVGQIRAGFGGGTGGTGTFGSCVSFNFPRNFKVSDGALFGLSSSDCVITSTDGNTFSKRVFALPNCTPVSGSSFTRCEINGIAKSGSTIYAIGIKQVGTTSGSGSSTSETVTETKFYFASGSSLENLNFSEISDSNFSSSARLSFTSLPMIAAGDNVFVAFSTSTTVNNNSNFNSNPRVCGSSNRGGSWVCQTQVFNGSPGFLADLNGAILYDIYLRWNGTGFTSITSPIQGIKNTAIFSNGRTIFNEGTRISFTDTSPFAWANPISTTTATVSNAVTNGGFNSFYTQAGELKAIASSFSNNSSTYSIHRSVDNGFTWTLQTNLPNAPQGGISNATFFNNAIFVYTQSSSGTFTQKYYKTTDLSTWTEVNP